MYHISINRSRLRNRYEGICRLASFWLALIDVIHTKNHELVLGTNIRSHMKSYGV